MKDIDYTRKPEWAKYVGWSVKFDDWVWHDATWYQVISEGLKRPFNTSFDTDDLTNKQYVGEQV